MTTQKNLSIMKIIIANFKNGEEAIFTVKGRYKKWDKNDIPALLCINNLDGQLYDVFNHHTAEIIISKVGCIGLKKTSDFKIINS